MPADRSFQLRALVNVLSRPPVNCTNSQDGDKSVMAICVNTRYVDWFVGHNVSTVVYLV